MAQLTNTEVFANRLSTFDDELQSEKIKVTIREAVVSAGTTFTVKLPASLGALSNPHLEFDLEMDFPWSETCFPAGYDEWKDSYLYFNNGQPGASISEAFDLAVCAFFQDVYPGLSQNTVPHDLGAMMHRYAGSRPSLCCDPPQGLGWTTLFQNIQLNQDQTGFRIDESNQAETFEDFIDFQFMTKIGKDSLVYDQLMCCNVWGAHPALQSNLTPPLNISGHRRANKIERRGDIMTVTKTVSMPLPLWFGESYPLEQMGDCNLLFQMNANPTFTCVPRTYSGFMSLDQDSALGSFSNSVGKELIQEIWWSPCGADGTLFYHQNGEYSMISVTFAGIRLDTADLTEILGDPNLWIEGSDLPAMTDRDRLGKKRRMNPTCELYRTGITFFVRVASIDSPVTRIVLDATAIGKDDITHDLTGIPVIRDAWVKCHVTGSMITNCCLSNSGADQDPDLSNTTAQQLVTIQHSGNLTDEKIGSKGSVVISFAQPYTVAVPIFQADYSPITGPSDINGAVPAKGISRTTGTPTNTTNGPLGPTNSAYNADGFQTAPSINTQGNHYWIPLVENVGFEIKAIIGTAFNTSGILGTGPTPNKFVPDGFVARDYYYHKDELAGVTFTTTSQNDGAASLHNAAGTNNLPPIVPLGWRLKNVCLSANRMLLPKEVSETLDEMTRSDTGLVIERPIATTVRSQITNNDANTFTFQTIVQQPYAMKFAIRKNTSDPLCSNSGPFTTFSYFSLNQGSFNVVDYQRNALKVNFGGKWPRSYPYWNQQSSMMLPVTMYKGTGGNEYFMSKFRTAFSNMFGQSEAGSAQPFINGAYATKFNRFLDVIYPMNTLGGSATILPQTNWQCRFGVLPSQTSSELITRKRQGVAGVQADPVTKTIAVGNSFDGPVSGREYSMNSTIIGFGDSTSSLDFPTLDGTSNCQLVVTTYSKKQWSIKKQEGISTSRTPPTWFMTM